MVTTESPVLSLENTEELERQLEGLIGGMDAPDAESLGEEPYYHDYSLTTPVGDLPYLVPWFTETSDNRRYSYHLGPDGELYTFITSRGGPLEIRIVKLGSYTLKEIDEVGLIFSD